MGCTLILAMSLFGQTSQPPANKAGARPPNPLIWDATEKTIEAKRGDVAADFQFSVTNSADHPIQIFEIRTSCGCTVAEMPNTPWVLEPGAKGSFRATVDIRGRHGRFGKTMLVVSNAGPQVLGVVVQIPEAPILSRSENQELALGDRQAVFRGTCYTCHVEPIGGKRGALLYQAACTICHEAEPRATMVPDLMMPKEKRDANYWRTWIREGRDKTLMPAFAETHGGPLGDDQIESLVEFALKHFPTEPAKN
jgi:cytochrome c5